METSTGMGIRKFVIVGILGFLVGFGVSYLWLSGKVFSRPDRTASSSEERKSAAQATTTRSGTDVVQKTQEAPQDTKTKIMGATGAVAGNSVSVSDQPAGTSVSVAAISMDKRGWVVIHQDDHGAPGWVLGARRLEPGSYTNEAVDLLRPTVPGSVYYAMLHGDDGVDTFDLHKDLPITDASGKPVMMRFQTTGG